VSVSNEAQLEQEVLELKERFLDTQDLYREVCVLMFFRHGIAPTANKLYQLVRRGSMSAPGKALKQFWTDLRDKSRVRIEQPDLPAAVADQAGKLAASLWEMSMQQASESLEALRQEVVTEVEVARAEAAAAADRLRDEIEGSGKLRETADDLRRLVSEREAQWAHERATSESLRERLAQSHDELGAANAALADARRDFSQELANLRQSAQQAEHRLDLAEKRALIEIDRERTSTLRLQKDLQAANAMARKTTEDHEAQLRDAHGQLASGKTALAVAARDSTWALEQVQQRDATMAIHAETIAALRAKLDAMQAKRPPPSPALTRRSVRPGRKALGIPRVDRRKPASE
jgi:uncharacterized phage infection (PIP) family protein YhgE